MHLPSGIKALLFDLGGVVLQLDWKMVFTQWAKHCPFSPAEVGRRFSMDTAYEQHERGKLSGAEYFAHLRSMFDFSGDEKALIDGWNALFVGEVEETVAIIARLKSEVPVYLLTNSNPAHEEFWRATYADTIALFTDVFVSSTLGHRKPDRSSFAAVAQMTGIELRSMLFFDDSMENVAGARAAGLPAVLFTGPSDITRALSHH